MHNKTSQSFVKTTVAIVIPASAALILPYWKRKKLSKTVVINSATILKKGKFDFNRQNGTTDLTQTHSLRRAGQLKNI